jgi:large subunit ribosomal protein L25
VNQLRRKGILPGVVYGGDRDSLPVETDGHAFELSYRRWGNTTLLALTGLDGGEVPALIHDVSRDPRTGRLLHVDFARVSLTEKTHADVPLHFVNESPAIKSVGAVLLHALSEVTVEAFPQDIPRSIEVDVSGLQQIDDELFVRDLKIDPTLITIENEPDELVVKVVPLRVEEEEKPAEAAAPAEGEAAEEGEAAAPAAAAPEGAKAPGTEAAKAAAPKPGGQPAAAKAPTPGPQKKT